MGGAPPSPRGGGIYLFELATGKHLGCVPAHANAVAFDRTGTRVVAGAGSDVEIYRTSAFGKATWTQQVSCPDAKPIATLSGHAGKITSLAVGATQIVSASDDGTAMIWRLP